MATTSEEQLSEVKTAKPTDKESAPLLLEKGAKYVNTEDGNVYEFDGKGTWNRMSINREEKK